jgi:hypothetical protein
VEGRSSVGNADTEGGEGGGANELGEGQRRGEVAVVTADPTTDTERSGVADHRGGDGRDVIPVRLVSVITWLYLILAYVTSAFSLTLV